MKEKNRSDMKDWAQKSDAEMRNISRVVEEQTDKLNQLHQVQALLLHTQEGSSSNYRAVGQPIALMVSRANNCIAMGRGEKEAIESE